MSDQIMILGDCAYSTEAKAVISFSPQRDIFQDGKDPVALTGNDTIKVVPWGSDNRLPMQVLEMIEKGDVIGANIKFNVSAAYGLGIKPMMRTDDPRVFTPCRDEKVLEFFEENDIDGYFLEQLWDLVTFGNVFPEIVVANDGKKITSLRHNEAVYSRFASMKDKETEISNHIYAEWDGTKPKNNKYTVTPVLSRYNTSADLKDKVKGSKARRFVLQVPIPSPGRMYYARPTWWSIFLSGWYDVATMLPDFKKALLKNHLSIRYIVNVSEEYWKERLRLANVAKDDTKGEMAVRQAAAKEISDFLLEGEKGKGLITTKKIFPMGNGVHEDKYIEVTVLDSGIKGGEFIEDSEEASNIICYTMEVHPSLIGATPGKTKGSMSGTDKRELFMIKQALMKPWSHRLLKPLELIKRYNGWPKELVFAIPEYQFTTLDESKNGKKETIQ